MADPGAFAGAPICVVGNINRDVKALGVPASLALCRDGETPVRKLVETIGGGGANSACAAAALGRSVRFVGKVGVDPLGDTLARAMKRQGVETHLARDPRCATGTTVALGYTDGQRHFLSCLPNNETLAFEDLDLTALTGCVHLLRADVWFSSSMLESGNLHLFTAARLRGITTSLDLNFDPCWSTDDRPAIARRKGLLRETLGMVDLAHGNIRELCEFADTTRIETALERLTDWGVKAVVVHMGSQGAGFWSNRELIVVPPATAKEIVNATGTGDVLSTCMILLHDRQDLSVAEKLQRSNHVVRDFMEGRLSLIPEL